jgi:uncharacterized protein (DUF885 family)
VPARSPIPGGIPDGARGPDLPFYRSAERYLAAMFRAYPTLASAAGYHAHDGALEDLSAGGIVAKLALARRSRDLFARIDPDRLSASARVDHALILNEIEAAIFTLEELRPFERDPQSYVELIGYAMHALTLLPEGSPLWAERLASILSRMRAIPSLLAAARANLGTPARVVTELAQSTHAGTIGLFERQLPPLFEKAPAALRERLIAENARVLETLRAFQRWLDEELLPRSTGDWRLGRDLWTKKLHYALHASMTPEEILRRARERLADQRRRMLEVAAPLHDRMFPEHRHRETGEVLTNVLVREVLDRVTARHATRETLFRSVQAATEEIRRFIRSRGIITLPPDDDRFVIEPTPGFLDGVAVAFFNPPPTLDPDHTKSFWISSVPRGATPEADAAIEASFFREYNDYNLHGLAIHEAFPGHYVQYWHALRSPFATLYKKIFASGTFAEGWAVLAETLMVEAGYRNEEPENLLIHIKQQLRPPTNAMLDVTLHTEAMPEEEADRWALDLMQNQAFQEEAEARGKLRRAKVSSAQLSTYFVGFVEISGILEEERRRAGASFDLRAFNERLLSFGTIPPAFVRRLMDEMPAGPGS